MATRSLHADDTNEIHDVMTQARIKTVVPTVPIFPIPTACAFNYCSESPAYTMNGEGLCATHFHTMIDGHTVKIPVNLSL